MWDSEKIAHTAAPILFRSGFRDVPFLSTCIATRLSTKITRSLPARELLQARRAAYAAIISRGLICVFRGTSAPITEELQVHELDVEELPSTKTKPRPPLPSASV